jgi:hypothetical protein
MRMIATAKTRWSRTPTESRRSRSPAIDLRLVSLQHLEPRRCRGSFFGDAAFDPDCFPSRVYASERRVARRRDVGLARGTHFIVVVGRPLREHLDALEE